MLVVDNVGMAVIFCDEACGPYEQAINLRILEVFAKKAGHIYGTAYNGEEAVKIYERCAKERNQIDGQTNADAKLAFKPEVIHMDINMPVMNGLKAARAISNFEHTSGCARAAIIAVTGCGNTSAEEQATSYWYGRVPHKIGGDKGGDYHSFRVATSAIIAKGLVLLAYTAEYIRDLLLCCESLETPRSRTDS